MKKHLKKMRLLLLFAVLFMLTNCQEEFQDTPPTQQSNKGEHTILTGAEALEMKAKLITYLEKSGGIGLSRLSSKLIDASSDPNAATLNDVKQYIDDSEVYRVKMAPGKENYTYQINIPNASSKKFYNLVVKQRGALKKTILVAYNLNSKFESEYAVHKDFSKFSGYIAYEVIASDNGFPCNEEPGPVPVSGGTATGPGGGGPGGAGPGKPNPGVGTGIGGPYNPGNPYSPYNQLLVDAKFQALKISAGVNLPEEDWEYVSRSPRWFKIIPGISGSNNPCDDEDEIGILDPANDPDKRNCEELAAMMLRTGVQASFNDLNTKTGSFREYGYKFEDGKTPKTLSLQQGTNNHMELESGGQVYGGSHTHPDSSQYDYIPMFSLPDIVKLGQIAYNYKPLSGQVKNIYKCVITLTVKTPSGNETYALKINNWNQFGNYILDYNDLSKQQKMRKNTTLNKKYSYRKEHGGGMENYLKDLFNFMAEENLGGVAIYKANADFSEWSKQEYDPQTNTITPKPCN